MNITFLNKIPSKTLLFGLILLFFLAECGLYKKTDARKVPVNAKDRVQKNIEEGRRIKFGNLGKSGSGSFEFATSNEMWRATVDILDFIPLANADYGGGVIITDWYQDETKNISYMSDSGYISLKTDLGKMIIDVGNIGIDHNPGHAHADTFSFELS